MIPLFKVFFDYKYWEYTEKGKAIKKSGIRKMTLLIVECDEDGKYEKDQETGLFDKCHKFSICIPTKGVSATKEFKWKYKKQLYKQFIASRCFPWMENLDSRKEFWENVRLYEDPKYLDFPFSGNVYLDELEEDYLDRLAEKLGFI